MELEPSLGPFLEPYLPPKRDTQSRNSSEKYDENKKAGNDLPFITLTWAQSLDAKIAAQKGTQTKISGPQTKVMTHFQRSRHDAILVGSGTVLADDPKLNCRFPETGSHMIRPVVLDPSAKWQYSSSTARKVFLEGAGIAPFVVVGEEVGVKKTEEELLDADGGRYVRVSLTENLEANWLRIFKKLRSLGIESVMVEGGAFVIKRLLAMGIPDSVVITVGSVFLGENGVSPSPEGPQKLKDVSWWNGQEDAVMAARPATTNYE